MNNDVVRTLYWEFGQITATTTYGIIRPDNGAYEPPVDVVPKPKDNRYGKEIYKLSTMGFRIFKEPYWGFEFIDPQKNSSTDIPLISTKNQTLVMMDKYN